MSYDDKVSEVIKVFDKLYNDADCSLTYENPLQLLISTQLAAQCTDARVNIVAKTLYKKYQNVYDFANSDLIELEDTIKPTGFYHNKARNIQNTCRIIITKFNGIVPDKLEDLLLLPGVGRKTANLVLGVIYKVPGVVVDTHAKRVSKRLGLTESDDPKKVEFDLMEKVPKEYWIKFCHQMVFHGRAVCKSIRPKCEKCMVYPYCNYPIK